jgi:hypothetical protein
MPFFLIPPLFPARAGLCQAPAEPKARTTSMRCLLQILPTDCATEPEKLWMNGFQRNPGLKMTVTDRETKVEVDLLPGGKKVDPGPLTLPMPTQVSEQPRILTLEKLISAKLSTYIGRGIERSQDLADVVKLVQANHLPRDYGVDSAVRDEYHRICDGLHQKKA